MSAVLHSRTSAFSTALPAQRKILQQSPAATIARQSEARSRFTGSHQTGHRCICQAADEPVEAISQSAAANHLKEYTDLKADINSSVKKFIAFISIYLLLVTTSDIACCTALGSLVGYGYLQLLMRDVDSFKEDDPIAAAFLSLDDSSLNLAALRSPKKVFAALRAALRPRLLVLLGLGAAVGAYNAVAPEPLNGSQIAALFGGFLSYKSGLLNQVWEALRPRFDPEALVAPRRPQLAQIEEEDDADEEEWRRRLQNPRPGGGA